MTTGLGLDVATLATTVFDTIVGKFTAAGIDLPSRRAIVGGAVEQNAWDQECLLLGMSGIGRGPAPGVAAPTRQAGPGISAASLLRHVVFSIQLVRCNPEPTRGNNPPPAAVLTEAGLALMQDAGRMSQALVEVCTDLTKVAPGTMCEAGAVVPVGPDGGLVAMQGSIALTIGHLI